MSTGNRLQWRPLLLIAGLTSACYLPSLALPFISDTYNQINLSRGLGPLDLFTVETYHYYRPLLLNSYLLDYTLWGLQPAGYRITTLLLHLLNTFLVYRLVMSLPGTGHPAALVAALWFGITPVHAPSVVWVLGRSDLLYTTFYLGACLCLI
jgi:hypothetical protein